MGFVKGLSARCSSRKATSEISKNRLLQRTDAMKLLLKAALLNRKHFTLLFFTVIAMFMLTIGSQMEMFSLGVIAKTGPDLFVLFGKEEKGKLEAVKELSLSDVEAKWDKIAQDPNGIMTQKSANVYMA